MAHLLNIEFTKTYATQKNAVMAVEKLLGENQSYADTLRYIVVPVEGASPKADGAIRYGVLFIGESAIQAGMHFHFNCVN